MKKPLIAVLSLCVILYICHRLGVAEMLKDISLMKQFLKDLGFIGYFVFILISVLVSVFLLPGQFLAIIAGVAYGGLIGGLLTIIGATIGSLISFVIGKYIAREYVVKKFGNNPIFHKIEKGVEENGISFLILTRLVPVFPYAIQSYAYALTPMRVGTFTMISFVTMIPASFIYAYMASEIVETGFSVKLMIEFAIAGVVLFLLSLIPKIVAKKKKISLELEEN